LCSDFNAIALKDKKYELVRFWLLGTWLAEQEGLEFRLVNLTRSEKGKTSLLYLEKHIVQSQQRMFK